MTEITAHPMGSARRHRLAWVIVVFVLAFAFRWLGIDGLGGDDHWSLWNAATFLKGDTPFREFVDMGNPLHWFMSAVAQWLVGYRVIGEVALGVALSAIGIALAFDLAWEASGSRGLAFVLSVAVMVLVTVAKLYSYPKIFAYPLGLWLAWRYIDKPTLARTIGLAAGVVVAFGYRHDHGAYVGLASMAAVLAAHRSDGLEGVLRALARFTVTGALLLAPYFVWIQVNEGLVTYFRERITFARQLDEAGRRAVPWVIDQGAPDVWLGLVPSPPARVAVAWTAMDASEQAALAHRFGLTGTPTAGATWQRYVIADASESNLAALMADPRVRLTKGITGSFRLVYGPLDPAQESPQVTIVWTPAVSAESRADAEHQYRLSPVGPHGDSGSSTYVLGDRSPGLLMALVTDRRVGQISGLRPLIHPVVVRLEVPAIAGPVVSVRWKSGLSDEERKKREAQYSLAAGREKDPGSRWWRYEAADSSDDNISRLVADVAFEEEDGIVDGDGPGRFRVAEHQAAGGRISLLWEASVGEEARAVLERQYHLTPMGEASAMTEYVLTNTTADNIKALVKDPHVKATSGIDRSAFTMADEPRLTTLGRAHPWLRLRVLPRYAHEANTGVFIYYVMYGLPIFALGLIAIGAFRWPTAALFNKEQEKVVVAALMATTINVALMRKLGYFPDHADVAIVLAAWATRRMWAPAGRLTGMRRAAIVLMALLVTAAGWTYADASSLSSRFGFAGGMAGGLDAIRTRSAGKMASPPIDYYAPVDSIGDRAVIRYLYECTKPEDRIWLTTDVYTIPYYTERRVVGHIFWGMGFMASDESQAKTIALLERDPVPFIFGVGGARPLQFLEKYDRVHEYVSKRYTETHAILQDHLDREGRILWLAVDGRRRPVRTYEPLKLPCFR